MQFIKTSNLFQYETPQAYQDLWLLLDTSRIGHCLQTSTGDCT